MAVSLLLCGCATTSTGLLAVKRVDHNQYEISSHLIGSLAGAGEVQAQDDQVATRYCAQKGQVMTVIERHGYGGLAPQDILTFRCGTAATAQAKGAPEGKGAKATALR